jgi:hypothetical protein
MRSCRATLTGRLDAEARASAIGRKLDEGSEVHAACERLKRQEMALQAWRQQAHARHAIAAVLLTC